MKRMPVQVSFCIFCSEFLFLKVLLLLERRNLLFGQFVGIKNVRNVTGLVTMEGGEFAGQKVTGFQN